MNKKVVGIGLVLSLIILTIGNGVLSQDNLTLSDLALQIVSLNNSILSLKEKVNNISSDVVNKSINIFNGSDESVFDPYKGCSLYIYGNGFLNSSLFNEFCIIK